MIESATAQAKSAKIDRSTKAASASKSSAVDAKLHKLDPVADPRPLRSAILGLKQSGQQPSVESISAELTRMSPNERASAIQSLQQTHGNRYVQMIIYRSRSGNGGVDHKPSNPRPDLVGRLAESSKTGQTIEPDVRSSMESSFGQNLGNVRLHKDTEAARLAMDINAQAFTVGQDIFFGSGKYQPHTQQGRALLAHEVTHTRQQTSAVALQQSPQAAGYSISSAGDPAEREAESVAGRVAAGLPIEHFAFSPVSREQVLILRQAANAEVAQVDIGGLAAEILASLRSDPRDRSGQARELILGIDPVTREAVLDRVRSRTQPRIFSQFLSSLQPEAGGAEAIKAPPRKDGKLKSTEPPGHEAAKPSEPKAPAARMSISVAKPATPAKPAETRGTKVEPGPGPEKPEAKPAEIKEGAKAEPVMEPKMAAEKPAEASGGAAAATAAAEVAPGVAPSPGEKPSPAPKKTAEDKAAAAAAPPEAEGPMEEAPKEAQSPEGNPDFQAVVKKTKKVAEKAGSHVPAKSKSAEAEAAAAGPPNEVASKAADGQVQAMSKAAAKPKPFDRAAFKKTLMEKIASITPNNLKEADEFKGSGKAESLKGDLTSQVTKSKEQSQGEVKEKVEQEPDQSGIKPKPVTKLPPAEAGPEPADIGAAQAAPKPASESEVSLQQGSRELDSTMSSEGVTEEQLTESNEPSFKSALSDKKSAQADAAEKPQEFRKEEQAEITLARSEMTATSKSDLNAIHKSRGEKMANVAGLQLNAKGTDEQEMAKVSNDIQEIYKQTTEKVKARLKRLDDEVNAAFDKGAADATAVFEDYVGKKMDAYKDKRYGGLLGGGYWLKDRWFDLPKEVNEFYVEGKKLYISKMDEVLNGIAATVETGLNESREIIDQGKNKVQEYVGDQQGALKSVAEEAAREIQGKFETLENRVNEKQEQLIDSLAKKYVESSQQIDARIEKMKEDNKGLVSKARDAIVGVIEAIRNLKNMLLRTLARAASAIGTILAHPITFLGNLVAGVKQGLNNFMGKIGKYLLEGMMGWLFGALAEAGIKLPESFDLKGILSLVFQVLGLTYENIRARAVELVGKKIVGTLETTAGIIYDVMTKGPGILWNWIKDKLGDLKSMILEPIKSFVQEKIIIAGITWLLGLLNPAGAFIKAVKAIYDIIMFFVERGRQIMALVDAVIDSVTAIAVGNIGVAANLVEKALIAAIPVAIGFLAALLGIGGISEKIKSVIEAIRAPINKAIDWVIDKAVKAISKIKGIFTGVKDEKGTPEKKVPDEETKATVKADALEDLKRRIAAKPMETFEELQGAVNQVFKDYSPHGLGSIRINLSDEKSLKVDLVASASDPERRTIYWKDIFAKGDPIASEYKAEFEKQGYETYAALSIDGTGIAVEENSGSGHAEQVLLDRHWKRALEIIHGKASKGKPIIVAVAINRTPCDKCTQRLIDAIAEAKSNPLIKEHTRFILAPTGLYEPSEKLTPEEMAEQMSELELQAKKYGRPLERIVKQQLAKVRFRKGATTKGATTSMKHLEILVGNGWDLHQLIARRKPTTSGNILGKVAQKLHPQLNKIEANK